MSRPCAVCQHTPPPEDEDDYVREDERFREIQGPIMRMPTGRGWGHASRDITLEACPCCGTVRLGASSLPYNVKPRIPDDSANTI